MNGLKLDSCFLDKPNFPSDEIQNDGNETVYTGLGSEQCTSFRPEAILLPGIPFLNLVIEYRSVDRQMFCCIYLGFCCNGGFLCAAPAVLFAVCRYCTLYTSH
jgi:hypothetical protein